MTAPIAYGVGVAMTGCSDPRAPRFLEQAADLADRMKAPAISTRSRKAHSEVGLKRWGGGREVETGSDAEVLAQLLTFVEQTADFVGVSDPWGRILYLNPAAREAPRCCR